MNLLNRLRPETGGWLLIHASFGRLNIMSATPILIAGMLPYTEVNRVSDSSSERSVSYYCIWYHPFHSLVPSRPVQYTVIDIQVAVRLGAQSASVTSDTHSMSHHYYEHPSSFK